VAQLYLVRRLTNPRMDTFITLGCLEYHADQRRRFREGILRRQWCDQFPQLFDHDDFTRASNRTRSYFFFEWLAAIVLHQSTGFFALVTRYQTDARKRPLLPDICLPTYWLFLQTGPDGARRRVPTFSCMRRTTQIGSSVSAKGPGTPSPIDSTDVSMI
jgi:hypothetical protein